MTGVLAESRIVTIGADGTGRVQLGPTVYGLHWKVKRMTTSGNSVLVASVDVYRGGESDVALIDHSDTANADVSETDLDLRDGDFITVVYRGGTPGAQMGFRVEGDMTGRNL